jgi:hypothetical protein
MRMKKDFTDYLESIGITDPIIKRIEEICQFHERILTEGLKEEIVDIFVTDYILKDGTRQYENLWLFSKNYVMEAKLFIKQDDFDISPYVKLIDYLAIKKESYDFIKFNEKSKLYIEYVSKTNSGEFKATKENCDYLRNIYLKYMLPNVANK